MLRLLAVICPPAAVLAADRRRLVPSLVLTACFVLPGIVHALSVVSQRSLEKRYDSVMRALTPAA